MDGRCRGPGQEEKEGQWCLLFYERYFNIPQFRAAIRTRDLDIAIPVPPRFGHKVDIGEMLEPLGFVVDFKGREGYIRFLHPDLIVEFLVPERGRSTAKPFDVPKLGINAQPLRFLDLLLAETIIVPFQSASVRLPHPAHFAIHKFLISGRRQSDKAERDREQAATVAQTLQVVGEGARLRSVFAGLPRKWKAQIMRAIEKTDQDGIASLFPPPTRPSLLPLDLLSFLLPLTLLFFHVCLPVVSRIEFLPSPCTNASRALLLFAAEPASSRGRETPESLIRIKDGRTGMCYSGNLS